MIRSLSLLPIAAFAIVTGCDLLTGPFDGDAGSLSFRYAGVESGTFSARGAWKGNSTSNTHAAGQLLREGFGPGMQVEAYERIRGGLADRIQFFGAAAEPGIYPIGEGYQEGAFRGEFAVDIRRSLSEARMVYVLVSGRVTIESVSSGRIRGTFYGTACRLIGPGTIQILDGIFDVPDNLPQPID